MPFTIPNAQDSPTYQAQAVQDKTDLAAIANIAQGNGVYSGCTVSPGGGYTVNVAAGVIYANGLQVAVSAVTGLAPAAASSTDRRDIVVASAAGAVSIVAGTSTTETAVPWTTTSIYNPPVKPAIPAGSVLLAEIYIPGGGGTIVSGWITDKTLTNTGLTSIGSQTAIRTAANQDVPRRGGNIGVATSVDTAASFTFGQIEAVIGDSIAAGTGASGFGKTDWTSVLANQENRVLGLADAGLGFTDCGGGGGIYGLPQFSAVGASLTAVTGIHPEINNALTAVQLTGTVNASTATNSLTDNRVFNRALVFFKPTTNADGIGVSVTGAGGSVFATIDPHAAVSSPLHGNATVDFYDTGVISSPSTAPTISLTRRTAVTGAGGVAPTVYGVLYYAPGVAGTSGLSVFNISAGGTTTADWTALRTWESALGALGGSIRRVHVRLGCNDTILARSVGDAAFNNSTTLTSSTAVFTPGDVGRPVSGNVNIPAGTTIVNWISSTQVTLNQSTTGGNLTNQIVTFGQIPVATTMANLTTVIQRMRAQLPRAEITLFGEYQPGAVVQPNAGVVTPTAYQSNIVPMFQSVAYNNNCSYVDMFSRFGSTQNRSFGDASISNGSATIGSASGAQFCALDVGSGISGPNIPTGATITAVASTTLATMSANATGSAPAPVAITAVSASAGTVTFTTATQAFTSGQKILISGLTGGFGVLNGCTVTVLASGLTTTSFGITNSATGSTTTGTATPAYVINADIYGLTMDGGIHFGDATNSGGKVDGQRAHADEVWERLGYSKALPPATPGAVTLTSGTNWLCPTSGTYLVTCVGGGGAGGGGGTINSAAAQQGGAGGAAGGQQQTLLFLTAGTLYPYTIGAAGTSGTAGTAGGNAGGAGGNGGNTSFGSGPSLNAPGGTGGVGGTASSTATQNYSIPGGNGFAVNGSGAINSSLTPLTGAGGVYVTGLGPTSGYGIGGGSGGGAANATNCGGAGSAGTLTAIAQAVAAGSGSSSAAGTNGANAAAPNYGCGGGGGGGGCKPGATAYAGGAGGTGAPGVIYIQKVG